MGSTETRTRWPLRRWLIVALPIATVVGLLPFAAYFGTMRHAQRVTAQEANDRLHQDFRLPLGSTNVNYSTSVKSSHVTLDLSLDDLMKWCEVQRWRTREIGQERPAPFRELNAEGTTKFTHLVSRGLEFGDRVGDLGFWGVYDSALGRASVSYIATRVDRQACRQKSELMVHRPTILILEEPEPPAFYRGFGRSWPYYQDQFPSPPRTSAHSWRASLLWAAAVAGLPDRCGRCNGDG